MVAFGAWLLLCGLALPVVAVADVYKYVDTAGNVYFSDKPLVSRGLRLEWKRTAKRLVAENRQRAEQVAQAEETARAEALIQGRLTAASVTVHGHGQSRPVSGAMSLRRAQVRHLIDENARRFGLSADLLHAVIRAESAYRSDAQSHAGACGLMQLMPATAERFSVADIWDPAENIRGGAAYLRFLLDLFDGDLTLALAAYNAGENAVRRHGDRIPPYPETLDYVRKVLRHLSAEQGARPS
ncbi:lytic transglycosylase domain-containing protein [Thiohalocapsa marina]|uniref:Lytic transglycosylase domain-containing protein n=1 Tax=Thiohalocapsa marina TaxID=424902 RepID=A0A5M8FP78_9GAMM|nr:transglycosylase SLT domain-containing protein [Thiohalocapsa marina]KAA6186607.1 lytic transglycosylase domain-containing protein [Thiohalocapsa marina]